MTADATLWATCACLFVGALTTGLLPLWPAGPRAFALVERAEVRMLSAGLMLGSGLGVVIPEGFHAFAQGGAAGGGAGHEGGLPEWLAGGALLAGFLGMLLLQLRLEGGASAAGHGHGPGPAAGAVRSGGYTPLPPAEEAAAKHGLGQREGRGLAAVAAALPPAWGAGGVNASGAGVARVAAGADMELGHRGGGEGTAAPGARQRRELDGEAAAPSGLLAPSAGGGDALLPSPGHPGGASRSPQLVLGGLLVHSAADGLAVGAASLGSSGPALTLAVAGAIMLHKLPVSLGLTTYLRAAGWPARRVLQGLLLFSVAAPAAALATYYLLRLLMFLGAGAVGGGSEDGGAGAAAGQQLVALAVLLSGGTFLAAATLHILPTALHSNTADGDGDGSTAAGGGGGARSGDGPSGVVWVAAGAVLPLLLAALLPEAQ